MGRDQPLRGWPISGVASRRWLWVIKLFFTVTGGRGLLHVGSSWFKFGGEVCRACRRSDCKRFCFFILFSLRPSFILFSLGISQHGLGICSIYFLAYRKCSL